MVNNEEKNKIKNIKIKKNVQEKEKDCWTG